MVERIDQHEEDPLGAVLRRVREENRPVIDDNRETVIGQALLVHGAGAGAARLVPLLLRQRRLAAEADCRRVSLKLALDWKRPRGVGRVRLLAVERRSR